MNILLVNPPIPRSFYNREFHLPTSLLYLGAVLEKHCDHVEILDFKPIQHKAPQTTDSQYDHILLSRITDSKAEIVGFGGLFSGNYPDVLRMAKIVKDHFPNITTLLGGVHPTMYTTEILTSCTYFDYLFIGEAEDSIISFMDAFSCDKKVLETIPAIAFRRGDQLQINKRKSYIDNLDDLPFPAYHLIDFKDYYVDTQGWHNPKNLNFNLEIPLITSRSCPHDCNFCAASKIMGRGWRPRSAGNVVNEIELLYNRYNQRHFAFMDDNLTFSKKRILEICNLILKRGLNIQFETHNGVSINTLDAEVIEALAAAGLTRIALPIESGSDFIRNTIMRKKLSRSKIFDTVNLLRQYKQIFIRTFFIIGLPEETQQTLQDTYEMIEELNVDKVHLTNIVPFPGTEVYQTAQKDNLFVNINPSEFYLSDALYQTNYDHFSIKPYNLSIEELKQFRKRCDELILKLKH